MRVAHVEAVKILNNSSKKFGQTKQNKNDKYA